MDHKLLIIILSIGFVTMQSLMWFYIWILLRKVHNLEECMDRFITVVEIGLGIDTGKKESDP